jgi:hypothetical protein
MIITNINERLFQRMLASRCLRLIRILRPLGPYMMINVLDVRDR